MERGGEPECVNRKRILWVMIWRIRIWSFYCLFFLWFLFQFIKMNQVELTHKKRKDHHHPMTHNSEKTYTKDFVGKNGAGISVFLFKLRMMIEPLECWNAGFDFFYFPFFLCQFLHPAISHHAQLSWQQRHWVSFTLHSPWWLVGVILAVVTLWY